MRWRRVEIRETGEFPQVQVQALSSACNHCENPLCMKACPVDAIELTSLYNLTGRSREEMVFDKEKLLSVFDQTKDDEPMQSPSLGGTV